MPPWIFRSAQESETIAFAERLAALLPDQAVITLEGTLGAGKTRFVQGLAIAAGVDPREVVSPTFTLVQEYAGRVPIYHFDAYRIYSDTEFLDLGFDEYLGRPGWCLIEWSSRVEKCLPPERLAIAIEVTGETSRQFTLQGHGAELEVVVRKLKAESGGAKAESGKRKAEG